MDIEFKMKLVQLSLFKGGIQNEHVHLRYEINSRIR